VNEDATRTTDSSSIDAERRPDAALQRVLVAYDGSPPSRRAALLALALARTCGGRVWFVHAHQRDRATAEPLTDEAYVAPMRAISRSMSRLVSEASSSRIPSEVVVREGSPADVIETVASEVGASLIVVGTRGLGGAARLILGSVSAQVVGHSKVPVVVVP